MTETPCIALNNISDKVYGVYQWISDLPYIEFAESIDALESKIARVVKADRKFDNTVLDTLQSEFKTYAEKIRNAL
mgnify:FL=1